MEWELYEKYKAQDDKALEFTERYAQKVRDAKESVAAAVVVYEDVLRKGFAGESVGTQKKKALGDIDKAKAALQVAEKEASQANEYAEQELQGRITVEDLWADWDNSIEPKVQKERVQPIIERAQKAILEYYRSIVAYYELNNEFNEIGSDLNSLARGRKGAQRYFYGVFQDADMPKIDEHIIEQIHRYQKLPVALQEKTN
ncbi:hypothetical protein [Bacillus gaemokensis]|uniref:Uncharacterized protein n=1 Tax=Bacillus gaemokensis TaxID=574375 RepID=A0A073KS04_9BACI|nr:hypothetical protein [Bacillus gaemokensis]KEK25168.1 hypothetical protein BAGA_11040 [Bacillus gaemokensis]KYG37389.1 hypothetical protein AZF08_08265 [Bacillus gaemokensis]